MAGKVSQASGAADGKLLPDDVQTLVEPRLSLATWEDAERLFRSRRQSMVPVEEPLVLVSQVQRSGGTLISSLLDGHRELHVHPYELHIGHPTKYDWPPLDVEGDPDDWLAVLRESRLDRMLAEGYMKAGQRTDVPESLPFALVPSFLERLFRLTCLEREPSSPREIIACYFTALHNAWLDRQGLRDEPKRWVAGFAPRLAWGESRGAFFGDCPDGRVIACLRDPRGWYASASRFSNRYGELDQALELWMQGAREIADAKGEEPDRVLVLTFEVLVTEPGRAMRSVADWLGIAWDPVLLEPTFNRLPTEPNTSFPGPGAGVIEEAADRWRTALDRDVVRLIEARAMELDAEVRSIADVR